MALSKLEKRILENEKKVKKSAKAGAFPDSLLLKGAAGVFGYFCVMFVVAIIVLLLASLVLLPRSLVEISGLSFVFSIIFTVTRYVTVNRKD